MSEVQITPLPEYITVEDAAKMLGLTERALLRNLKGKGIALIRVGNAKVFATKELIEVLDGYKDYTYALGGINNG